MREDIQQIILGLLEDEDVYVEALRGGDYTDDSIVLLLDTDKGILFKTLVRISKKIRNDEAFIDAGGDDYEVEVSSPGTNFQLTLPRHFTKNIGRNLQITHNREESHTTLTGILTSCDETGFILNSGKNTLEELHFLYEDIIKAKIKLKW